MNTATIQLAKPGYKHTKLGLIPEDWEVTTLDKLSKVITGSTPNTSKLEYYGNEFMFVGPSDLGDRKFIYKSEKMLSKSGFAVSREMPEGSVLFTCIGSTIGKIGLATQTLTSNQQINAIVPSQAHDNEFLYYQMDMQAPRIKLLAGEQAVPLINKSEFAKTKIPLPPLPEQQKIAQILSTWDAGISTLQQLIAAKQQHKKGLMQSLLTGKKRFPGFKEKWKEVRLGDVLKIGSGRDYKHLEEGPIPVYGTGGLMTYVNDYLYNGTSVGIGRKGTIDKPVLLTGKFWTVDTLFYTHSFDSCIPEYIFFLFLTINWKLYNEASGVPSLSKTTIEKIKVIIPTLPEQQKIAAVLSAADTEIQHLTTQLTALQTQKKGLMQKLLTGEVRVRIK